MADRNAPAKRRLWARLARAAALLGITTAVSVAAAQEKPPKAEEILDKVVEASGGKEALEKIRNRVTKGTLDFKGQGVKAKVTFYAARPNRTYVIMEAEEFGKVERGTTGETAWELSVTMGPSIKKGPEKADMLREATFDKLLIWRKLYPKVEGVGVEEIDGRPCYKLTVTPKDGKPQTWWVDRERNLISKVHFTLVNPMGEIPIESTMSDYKRVDGVMVPFKIRTEVMGQERQLTVESIEHNVDLPKDRFDPPAEVQELLKAEKAEKPEKEAP